MAEQAMAGGIDPNSVRKVVGVKAPQAVAWRVFTEQMGSWWPLENYKIGKARAIDAVVEPESAAAGTSVARMGALVIGGSVLVWEPHSRLVLSWDITADWQYDPNLKTEIELRFIADGKDATRVELEHRRLDRYGVRRDEMRRIFDVEGDWGRLLEVFARVAAAK